MSPRVLVHPDQDALVAAAAARLVTLVADAVAERGRARLVLTGGRVGTALLAALDGHPAARGLDWARVELWFGDERWLPPGDPERNETQARAALLDRLPLAPGHLHPMGADDGTRSVEQAARDYARELPDGDADVVLLGIGEDGHVASLMPGLPGPDDPADVLAVHDSPKPPPTRLSLGRARLCRSREVWLIAAGEGKADAVRRAFRDGEPLPAARVTGRERTLLLLDAAAAAQLAG